MRPHPKTLESELSADELGCLTGLLKTNHLSGDHLEIGTAAGGTLAVMMNCYDQLSRPHFVVIDTMTYFADQYDIIRRNLRLRGLDPDSVEFRVARSFDAFKEAERLSERFGFIFIDGAHGCRYVMQDLTWSRLLERGGFLCLHDYSEKTRGVIVAANRFLKKYPHYKKIALVGSLLVIQKTGDTSVPEVTWADHRYATMMSLSLQLRRSIEKRCAGMRMRTG
ncbi:MAG TPA: class I SAM-dependent methyltransferase [Nitrospiria bacterium]|nr:class I SAM-dependent methyltransferase [Nitrospiria bacterium]